MNTEITNAEIQTLATEAAAAGDAALEELCEAALDGDGDARRKVERIILDVRANG